MKRDIRNNFPPSFLKKIYKCNSNETETNSTVRKKNAEGKHHY